MAKSPWDPETEELIKKAQMMIDTGAVDGERQKPNTTRNRPAAMPKIEGSSKRESTAARKRNAKGKTARQEALKRFRKTGMIPASPTR